MKPFGLQRVAESVLGRVEWEGATTGYCQCPAEALHTQPNGGRDCRVTLDGVPTVFCFHTSCTAHIEKTNQTLRSVIAKVKTGNGLDSMRRKPTAQEAARQQQRFAAEQLRARASISLKEILRAYEKEPAAFYESSPTRLLQDPYDDWRLLLRLFKPEDIVWIGSKYASCNDKKSDAEKAKCTQYFRKVSDWINEKEAPEQFTCPSIFRPGTYSRCNNSVLKRRFLVIESDTLTKPQMAAVINWCTKFLRLRAIVDTGGKSLHGWFNTPAPAVLADLRLILPNLGRAPGEPPTLDPALFKLAQPCRLPGAWRERGRVRQALIYLDSEGGYG